MHENRLSNKEPHILAKFVLGSTVRRYVWSINPPVGVCIPHLVNILIKRRDDSKNKVSFLV